MRTYVEQYSAIQHPLSPIVQYLLYTHFTLEHCIAHRTIHYVWKLSSYYTCTSSFLTYLTHKPIYSPSRSYLIFAATRIAVATVVCKALFPQFANSKQFASSPEHFIHSTASFLCCTELEPESKLRLSNACWSWVLTSKLDAAFRGFSQYS